MPPVSVKLTQPKFQKGNAESYRKKKKKKEHIEIEIEMNKIGCSVRRNADNCEIKQQKYVFIFQLKVNIQLEEYGREHTHKTKF